jgi:Kef-type K+ transport system membrane component KefB
MSRILTTRRLFFILVVIGAYWVSTLTASGDSTDQANTDTLTTDTIVVPAEIEPVSTGDLHTGAEETGDEHGTQEESGGGHGSSEVSDVLLGLIIILLAAKIGGDIVERFKQPAVLGELIIGMIIGNMVLVGVDIFEPFEHSVTLEVLAEIGVIILLFQVGLESSIKEMMKVGMASFMVAVFGVVAPFFLGWGVSAWFLPDVSIYVHIFVGATLTATSVGITARVLQDIGKIKTREAKIILGAAVIDDIMGLVILAVVTGIITASSSGGELSSQGIFLIVFKAVAFVVGALVIGNFLAPRILRFGSKMHVKGVLLSTALLVCFTLAFLAGKIGLAPIVGAFAAGLILDAVHYKVFTERGEHRIDELVEPIATFLVPIFFVRMGMMVDLTTFARIDILLFAAVMTIAAIIGKQACSLAIFDKKINRIAIGLGMIPRGEVGLIFAGIGAKLMYNGEPVISTSTFSAVVIMVIITTLITPPFLKRSMLKKDQKAAPVEEVSGI